MIDFRFLVKKSLAVVKFMLLPVLLHTAAVKAEVTYIHTDYLGSVSAKSNASGQVIERFHYAPFGLPADSSELNNKQSYTGHVFDNESQLIYMQARYYDPVIGRFYSNDPVDYLGHMQRGNPVHGFGRYTYANNNPYKYTDPDGEFGILNVIGAVVGAYDAVNSLDSDASLGDKFAAGAVGAVVGGISGGGIIKGITKLAKATGVDKLVKNEAVKTGLKVTAEAGSGAIAGGVTQAGVDLVTEGKTSLESIGNGALDGAATGLTTSIGTASPEGKPGEVLGTGLAVVKEQAKRELEEHDR